MQRSEFLAKLIGPVFVVIGLGILANDAAFRALADEFIRNPALIYIAGLMTIVAGLALTVTHNVWVRDWRIIITIFGWLAVAGGALRILMPQQVALIGGAAFDSAATLSVGGIVVLLLGIVLSYYGYRQYIPRPAPVRAAARRPVRTASVRRKK